ncbi:hypothetical protein BDV96DRAFT_186278 [Lophiotrema nucula]|uniref:Putative gamma-glutamylcyclotransferase n=1 Tax=Lophiotrema nucula TaxID=690887 RepID=A0A6A5YV38_9PLEO|nr:hypothetical protein BDV96DRAFT_186278 [Lophiotrema nucula]
MYLVELSGILSDATKVQQLAELPSKPQVCTAGPEEGSYTEGAAEQDDEDSPTNKSQRPPRRFAIISNTARETLHRNLPPDVEKPLFIKLATYARKELSSDSVLPHLKQPSMDQTNDVSAYPQQDTYPVRYFFYGTLCDPDILSFILALSLPPELQDAILYGGKLRTWGGAYRALVDGDGSRDKGRDEEFIVGKMYEVQNEEDEMKLRAYESDAYEVVRCVIEVGGSCGMEKVLVFRYCGREDDLD